MDARTQGAGWMRRTLIMTVVALLLVCCGQAAAASLNVTPIAGPGGLAPFKSAGGKGPVQVISPPGDTTSQRVFVVTQDGYVYVIDHGVLQATPFLDLHALTDT